MSARLRLITNLGAGLATLGALALGGAWLADRAHRWEQPAWQPRAFVRLERGTAVRLGAVAAPSDRPGSRDRWVMPVNPRCSHCMTTLRRLHETWSQRAWEPDLITLIVDTPVRPGEDALVPIPTAQVWWDARGIWRGRWGHRLYGEIIQFDGAGRFVRTVLAQDLVRRRRLPLPTDTHAPAKGGG